MVMVHFGIVTPTYNRVRFLRPFIRNVVNQSYLHWTLTIVHDGPGESRIADAVNEIRGGDCRIFYLETPVRHRDMGNGPRLFGLEYLVNYGEPINYFLFWDDDNRFYQDALSRIERAIQDTDSPDLLLVPIRHKWRSLPLRDLPLREFPMGCIDTANLCIKAEIVIEHFKNSLNSNDPYHQDFRFYRSICDDASVTVNIANIDNIGCYDGLRSWEVIRWKLFPRPLYIYEKKFMRQIRRLFPRD